MRGLAREAPGLLLGEVTYLDVDGTIVPTTGSHKQGMHISYKGIWGYAPLLVSLANTSEVLYLVNRPGNAVSHQGAPEWIDRSIELVEPHANRIGLRSDTDSSLTGHFDTCQALPEHAWSRLERCAPYRGCPSGSGQWARYSGGLMDRAGRENLKETSSPNPAVAMWNACEPARHDVVEDPGMMFSPPRPGDRRFKENRPLPGAASVSIKSRCTVTHLVSPAEV